MAKSIWNGTIMFGLTAVPVKVYSATRDRRIHFHQIHEPDGARIEHKRICSKDGKSVPYKQIAKGYETSSGEYVLLSQAEIDAAAGRRSRLIELEQFVPREQLEPEYHDRAYYLGAGDDGAAAYRLLGDALRKTERSGIGRWVFHNREYLVAVRPYDDLLALHTLRFADELLSPGDLDLPAPSRAPNRRELEMARRLIETLDAPFDPGEFTDSYRDSVMKLIEAKTQGKQPELPEAPEPEREGDVLAALEASLESMGAKRSGSKRRRKSPAPKRRTPARAKARR
ncbi:MAG: Ku protein [Actinomycetota bacterium]|nr:Ku protein [Actinomycetota bacterium]